MILPESGLQKTWTDMVTNEHPAKCVKACLSGVGICRESNKPDNVSTVCQFLFNLGYLEHENTLDLHME